MLFIAIEMKTQIKIIFYTNQRTTRTTDNNVKKKSI